MHALPKRIFLMTRIVSLPVAPQLQPPSFSQLNPAQRKPAHLKPLSYSPLQGDVLQFCGAKKVKISGTDLGLPSRQFNLENVTILSGRANPELAKGVADYLGVKLGEVNLGNFNNGENKLEIKDNIRGRDVVLMQPTSAPVNDNLIELFLMIDAAKRAGAKSITTVIPQYGYARQDRRASGREPISAAWVAQTLENTGANHVVLMDIHSTQVEGCFKGPVDNLEAHPALMSYLKKSGQLENAVFISPDEGGMKRVSKLAKKYNLPWFAMSKLRSKQGEVEEITLLGGLNSTQNAQLDGILGILATAKGKLQELFVKFGFTPEQQQEATEALDQMDLAKEATENLRKLSEVQGKTAIVFDDMIDTAGTLKKAAEVLKSNGFAKVIVCASHGIFSGPAAERLQDPNIDEVVVADTSPLPPGVEALNKVTQVSVASIIGEAIGRAFQGESLKELGQLVV
jgi:ribose-phosphate pyrophosphokinase